MKTRVICMGLLLGASVGGFLRSNLLAQNLEWPLVKSETRPWTRWWWEGNAVRNSDVDVVMKAYREANLGGVEITPIYGVHGYEDRFKKYLSPEWMDVFLHTLDCAKAEGMGVDLANASGWPFGGPWVTQDYACKTMATKSWKLKGGEWLDEPIIYKEEGLVRLAGHAVVKLEDIKNPINMNDNLQDMALDQVRFPGELPLVILTANDSSGTCIDLTSRVDSNGNLNWQAPQGDWTLCALFEGLHGKLVERAGPGGEGDVIDHFSMEAIDRYLDQFDKAFKGKDISYLRNFFNDSYEVDDARGEASWTPLLFEEFQKRRGYDLRNYLPALMQLDTPDRNTRVLYDYRMTINDLLVEVYTTRWQQWAARQGKGIRNQAHGSPANILDLYAVSDVPEIEGRDLVSIKSAPSVAHTQGKPLVSSESATWLGEHFQSNLGNIKQALDLFFLGGVNHIFYHGTCFSPQDAPWPGWLFYAAVHFQPNNPFWEDFARLNQYVTRVQSFLQAGKPDNDLLFYYNIADLMSEPGNRMLQHFSGLDRSMNNSSVRKSAVSLTEQGYSWDMISDKQLMNTICQNGMLKTPGASYKAILVPDCHTIPLETLERFVFLAKQGATVLFHHFNDYQMAGMDLPQGRLAKFGRLLQKLSKSSTVNGVRYLSLGRGKVIMADDLAQLMKVSSIEPEEMYSAGLQCIRRQTDNGNTYFIANRTVQPFSGTLALNVSAESAAIFNPMTGEKGWIPICKKGGKTYIGIQLEGGESLLVNTFDQKMKGGETYSFYTDKADPCLVTGPWTLRFVSGGPVLPDAVELDHPKDWTTLNGDSYQNFSGSAIYSIRLKKIPDASVVKLDLGSLAENASVYLNGDYLATVIQAPYQVFVPAAKFKGNDLLEVKVANSMANRIAYMGRQGMDWQIFYNINISPRLKENNKNGKLDASHWKPKPSGLFGPVTLTAQKKQIFNK